MKDEELEMIERVPALKELHLAVLSMKQANKHLDNLKEMLADVANL